MLLKCGAEKTLESQGDQTRQAYKKSTLNIHWKDWFSSWSSNILATWCEESTHWKRPWCWERVKAGVEGVIEDEMVAWHTDSVDMSLSKLSCLLRNLYAGQEATVRTGHGTSDWFQIGKAVRQGCILSPCLFNLHAEYIMKKAGLEEAQAGIKIVRRNINNLRYADDTTLMAKSEGN